MNDQRRAGYLWRGTRRNKQNVRLHFNPNPTHRATIKEFLTTLHSAGFLTARSLEAYLRLGGLSDV